MNAVRRSRERGQVLVLFALLIPVFFALGAVVMDIGNWYVHKRHLQTQVDAAALAGGQSLYGCTEDVDTANLNVHEAALAYTGDPTRDASAVNQQVQASTHVHSVLNSTTYWSPGTPVDGTGYDYTDISTDADSPKIGPVGRPCYNGYIDVKATDSDAPKIFGLIPVTASPKTVARVVLYQSTEMKGVLPLGVPEVTPRWVAAIIVNEAAPNWQTDGSAVRAADWLVEQDPAPSGLETFHVYQKLLTGVNLNSAEDFGVFIFTSRDATRPSLTGSLATICAQTPTPAQQNQCFAYDGNGQDVSFIHSYSTNAPDPSVRDAKLVGGCPTDQSAPYFNLDAGCPMVLEAQINLGVPAGTDPRSNGHCYRVTSTPGGAMTWSNTGGLGTWVSPAFTPAAGSGKNTVRITVTKRRTVSNCSGQTDSTAITNQLVAAAYAADDASGGIQYLWVEYGGSAANSIPQPTSANLTVTVGFAPLVVDAPFDDPAILFRLGRFDTPSQTKALDCNVSGANGWRDAIRDGCQSWSVNERNGDCRLPWPNPAAPDCIDAENGSFSIQNAYRDRFIPDGCADNPNNWYQNGHTLPLPDDPRWAQLFLLDEAAFADPGKRTFPVRRFLNVYVTGGEGLNCPGDDRENARRNELWGHIVSYVTPDPDATPSPAKCSFIDGGVCVPVLVK